MTLSIYTASMQQAVAWIDKFHAGEVQMGYPSTKRLRTRCCKKKRLAENCLVQLYYDGIAIWCASGYGCNHLSTIARKRRREHMNRSRAQQARRAQEHLLRANE